MDTVTPHMTQEEELSKRREFAEEMYKMHVNESWWTRSCMIFLYCTCAAVTATLGSIWFSLAPMSRGDVPTGVYISLALTFLFLIAHIHADRRIMRRFQTEHPEDFHIWVLERIPAGLR